MTSIPTRQLDPASLDYLSQIGRSFGSAGHGVFIRRPGFPRSPRLEQGLLLLFGLTAITAALAAYAFYEFQPTDAVALDYGQAGLLALGVGLAVGGGLALRRPVIRSPVGHFLWADARFLWQVSPQTVRVLSVENLDHVRATHVSKERVYSHSEVFIRTQQDFEQLTLRSLRQAEDLVQFLNVLRLLRQPGSGLPVGLLASASEVLGAVAMRVVRDGPESLARGIAVASLRLGLALPRPEKVADNPANGQPTVAAQLAPWGLAAAVALAGVAVFPRVNHFLREERLYAQTAQVRPGGETPFQRYLQAYPHGRHAGEVRAAYDSNLYQFAQASPPGDEQRYQRYLQVFPTGSHAKEVRQAYEDNLYRQAQAAAPGAEQPYRRYETIFPKGHRLEQVRTGLEDNLAKYALASASGEEKRYRRYLEVFPAGPHAEQVRTAFADNLAKVALASAPGEEKRYQRYLEEFPRGAHAEKVRAHYENNLYQLARTGTSEEACQPYLRAFPQGQHAAEVRDLVDDRRFARANTTAQNQGSPTPLRSYLADAANTRHRPEAQEQINGLYDAAIADLKERAAASKNKIDAPLFETMSRLLEGLKTANSSLVTVGFKGTQIDEPTDALQKALEKFAYQTYLKEYPDLEALEKSAGTAILPRGQAFTPEQTARRETLILDRLRTAVRKVFKPDLLQLQPAADGQAPMITVAYEAFSPGQLYVYQQTHVETRDGVEVARQVAAKGLLRGYHIKWTIQVQLPGMEKAAECRLTSNPAASLRYDAHPGDPAWAPYAILLYSAFYDLSNRFITSFALDPGPAPKGFSFTETTGIEVPRRSGFNRDDE